MNIIKWITDRFEYTPHIYSKEDWKKHKGIFIALQLLPLIAFAAFAYPSEGTDIAIRSSNASERNKGQQGDSSSGGKRQGGVEDPGEGNG